MCSKMFLDSTNPSHLGYLGQHLDPKVIELALTQFEVVTHDCSQDQSPSGENSSDLPKASIWTVGVAASAGR
ncbi:hypothetical protein N7466_007675 [Penicillium verhagenii]|uniref:uncharacterized protein n=1 Tax=Penicillium verhagenii TaxID=1562060 RepID=UPI002544E6AC|nr:uncharacterized protein N7466_007675 [Penicillium verhagenii]KAJ5928719.1 hypothetical protein N7466_007675 [Penicillium verhagenii]